MIGEKLFYKYQSLEEKTDKEGNKRIYTIENLANNQLYFSDPTEFNDPFDCKYDIEMKGTIEQWIERSQKRGHNNISALRFLADGMKNGFVIKQGDFYYCDVIKLLHSNIDMGLLRNEDVLVCGDTRRKSRKRISREMNDFTKNSGSYGVCCFSETPKNILMWSHYTDYHQGICLLFRSRKGDILMDGHTNQFLSLYRPSTMEIVSRSIFYKIDYKDDLPEPANIFDMSEIDKWFKFLQTKFSDWRYEREYRLILPKIYFENQLLKYGKKSLEGVIFGLNISYDNAKSVYETVKKNYLDEGFVVKFYEAIEVPRKYALEIKQIDDVEKYFNDLL